MWFVFLGFLLFYFVSICLVVWDEMFGVVFLYWSFLNFMFLLFYSVWDSMCLLLRLFYRVCGFVCFIVREGLVVCYCNTS